MSKVIKVEDHVYNELDVLRGKGETFSQVIDSQLKARVHIFNLITVLEGHLKYREWQEQRLRELSSQ